MDKETEFKIIRAKHLQAHIDRLEYAIIQMKKELRELSTFTHLDAKQIIAELDERRARLAVANKPVSERINYDAPGILIPFQE